MSQLLDSHSACPDLGKSTGWGSLIFLSAHVCLATSPSLQEVRNHLLFISVSGTLLLLLKCLLGECIDGMATSHIFWYLCCRGLFDGDGRYSSFLEYILRTTETKELYKSWLLNKSLISNAACSLKASLFK